MDRKKQYPFSNSGISATQNRAMNAFNFNDRPFEIELERLDLFESDETNANNEMLNLVIEARKNLLEEAEVMRKMMRLDEFTIDHKAQKNQKSKKIIKKSIGNTYEDHMEEITDLTANEPNVGINNEDEVESNRLDEEATDEEEMIEDELEEVKFASMLIMILIKCFFFVIGE